MNIIKHISKVLLLSSLIFSVAGCGTTVKVEKPEKVNDPRPEAPTPHEVVSANIGSTGGELKDGDNFKLTFPSSALSSGTNITAQYIDEQSFVSDKASPGFLGAFEFGPSGTTFDKPVTVSMNAGDQPIGDELSVFCYDEQSKCWDYVGEAKPDSTGKAVNFEINHFSKYEVLDLTPDMLNKCLDLTYEAVLYDKPDTWIRDSYKDYLVNEKRVMDYYTTSGGYYYEPCGLFVYIDYAINGRTADQDELHISEGETNSFGNTFGLSQIGGSLSSKSEFDNAKKAGFEKAENFNVTVVVDYKMITPQIELSASEQTLQKGDTAVVSVYTHYAKPTNKLFPDIVLPNYPLSLPLPLEHLYTNKDELTTNDAGRATFTVTSRDGKAETVEVNFTYGGYFGTSVSNYVSFAAKKKKSYDFTGHISNEATVDYWIMDKNATGTSSSTSVSSSTLRIDANTPGQLRINVEFDISGIITWTESYQYEGLISYSNIKASIQGSISEAKATVISTSDLHDGHGNPIHEEEKKTTEHKYALFQGGGSAVVNPINQVAFSGIEAFGLNVITFEGVGTMPNLATIYGTGYEYAKQTVEYTLNSETSTVNQEGSASFPCEYWIFMGSPIMSGVKQKEGTQTITKDNYLKNSGYLADPYDPICMFDNETATASATQTITLTKRK